MAIRSPWDDSRYCERRMVVSRYWVFWRGPQRSNASGYRGVRSVSSPAIACRSSSLKNR